MNDMTEDELISRLIEEEKYKLISHRIIAEVVRDVFKLRDMITYAPNRYIGKGGLKTWTRD